jgi:hypothetical protein
MAGTLVDASKAEDRDRRLRSSSSLLKMPSVVLGIGKLELAETGGAVIDGWPTMDDDVTLMKLELDVATGGGP